MDRLVATADADDDEDAFVDAGDANDDEATMEAEVRGRVARPVDRAGASLAAWRRDGCDPGSRAAHRAAVGPLRAGTGPWR